MVGDSGGVTLLLRRWTDGDPAALDQLIPLVYGELQSLARRQLRAEPANGTLQTTALVHEVYLRLAGAESKEWANRGHFLAVCSGILRQVLVDAARARRAAKRNTGVRPQQLRDEPLPLAWRNDAGLIALNDSLAELAKIDPQKAQIVDLKYFGGFSIDEIAGLLGISSATVKRHWAVARVWLYKEIRGAEADLPDET